ncbi:MAG TPA: ribbon-helix-helix domain-containing protein [Dehalococcoidia bacterium]|nr:ribbon-helix-helix domain-containing protein [Dehalococcoidia bacterium]
MTASETARAHVVMPRELLEEIDKLAGNRKRSEFIVEAVEYKVRRERLGKALRDSAAVLDPADYPEWEDSTKWVHDLRQADQRHSDEKLGGWGRE